MLRIVASATRWAAWLVIATSPGVWAWAADTPRAPVVEFTSAERAWIAGHAVVRVLHLGQSGPYSFTDARGRVTGVNIDYLQRIGQLTGLRFEHAVENRWDRAFARLRAGGTDLLVGALGRTAQREEFMAFSEPYAGSPDVIVTRRDAPYLFSQRELAGLRVAYARTSTPEDNGATVLFYDNMREALHAVSRGEADAALVDAVMAAFTIKTDGLGNLRLGAILVGGYPAAHFGVRKDEPLLVSILDKALAQISQPERNAIRERWISLDYEAGQRWRRAFTWLAVVVGLGLVGFAVAFVYQRRLARELALRMRIQRELEQAHTSLQQTSQEKSELLRILAHDLRSPLTVTKLGIDALTRESGLASPARELLGTMRTSAGQMARLIGDLLDVQAIEEGRRTYRPEELDGAALLQELVAAFHPLAAPKKIAVTLHCEPAVLPLHADRAALRQVAENLISNAVKYSPAGTEVRVAARRAADGLVLSVSDNGPGLDAEDRAKLFQKYAPGKNRPTGGEQSLGVGLWIVKRIVSDLHGRVTCESAPGRGTVFTVELPARGVNALAGATRD